MELLSLKGSWNAFLESVHWSPSFSRAFQWCPRICSSHTPWNYPHSPELLSFLRLFKIIFHVILSYKKTEQSSNLPKTASLALPHKAAWTCWMWTSYQGWQRQDKEETIMVSKMGIVLGFFVVVEFRLSICLWPFYRGFKGKGRKFVWCLVNLKNPSPKLQRDFLENSVSGQGTHYKIQLVAANLE